MSRHSYQKNDLDYIEERRKKYPLSPSNSLTSPVNTAQKDGLTPSIKNSDHNIRYKKEFLLECFDNPICKKKPQHFPVANMDVTLTEPRFTGKRPFPPSIYVPPNRKDKEKEDAGGGGGGGGRKDSESDGTSVRVPKGGCGLNNNNGHDSSHHPPPHHHNNTHSQQYYSKTYVKGSQSEDFSKYSGSSSGHYHHQYDRDRDRPRGEPRYNPRESRDLGMSRSSHVYHNQNHQYSHHPPPHSANFRRTESNRGGDYRGDSNRGGEHRDNRDSRGGGGGGSGRGSSNSGEFVEMSGWYDEMDEGEGDNRRRGRGGGGGNYGRGERRSYEEEKEPEWYTEEMSRYDTIELTGLPPELSYTREKPLPQHQQQSSPFPRESPKGKNFRDGNKARNYRDGNENKNYGNEGRNFRDEGRNYRDGNEGRNYRDGNEGKNYRDGNESRNYRDGNEGKNYRDGNDVKNYSDGNDVKNCRDGNEGKNYRDGNEGKNYKDGNEGKNYRDGNGARNYKDSNEVKNMRDGNVSSKVCTEAKNLKDEKDAMLPKESAKSEGGPLPDFFNKLATLGPPPGFSTKRPDDGRGDGKARDEGLVTGSVTKEKEVAKVEVGSGLATKNYGPGSGLMDWTEILACFESSQEKVDKQGGDGDIMRQRWNSGGSGVSEEGMSKTLGSNQIGAKSKTAEVPSGSFKTVASSKNETVPIKGPTGPVAKGGANEGGGVSKIGGTNEGGGVKIGGANEGGGVSKIGGANERGGVNKIGGANESGVSKGASEKGGVSKSGSGIDVRGVSIVAQTIKEEGSEGTKGENGLGTRSPPGFEPLLQGVPPGFKSIAFELEDMETQMTKKVGVHKEEDYRMRQEAEDLVDRNIAYMNDMLKKGLVPEPIPNMSPVLLLPPQLTPVPPAPGKINYMLDLDKFVHGLVDESGGDVGSNIKVSGESRFSQLFNSRAEAEEMGPIRHRGFVDESNLTKVMSASEAMAAAALTGGYFGSFSSGLRAPAPTPIPHFPHVGGKNPYAGLTIGQFIPVEAEYVPPPKKSGPVGPPGPLATLLPLSPPRPPSEEKPAVVKKMGDNLRNIILKFSDKAVNVPPELQAVSDSLPDIFPHYGARYIPPPVSVQKKRLEMRSAAAAAEAAKEEPKKEYQSLLNQIVEKGNLMKAKREFEMELPLSRPNSTGPATVLDIYMDPLHPFTNFVKEIHAGTLKKFPEFVPRSASASLETEMEKERAREMKEDGYAPNAGGGGGGGGGTNGNVNGIYGGSYDANGEGIMNGGVFVNQMGAGEGFYPQQDGCFYPSDYYEQQAAAAQLIAFENEKQRFKEMMLASNFPGFPPGIPPSSSLIGPFIGPIPFGGMPPAFPTAHPHPLLIGANNGGGNGNMSGAQLQGGNLVQGNNKMSGSGSGGVGSGGRGGVPVGYGQQVQLPPQGGGQGGQGGFRIPQQQQQHPHQHHPQHMGFLPVRAYHPQQQRYNNYMHRQTHHEMQGVINSVSGGGQGQGGQGSGQGGGGVLRSSSGPAFTPTAVLSYMASENSSGSKTVVSTKTQTTVSSIQQQSQQHQTSTSSFMGYPHSNHYHHY